MAYAQKDGKDTVVFVDKEYIDSQEEEVITPQQKESEEKDQSAAYDPETGEINWDCPCLGGMAQGPCGEQFKAAFSCFVYSEAEPKGVDCIEKFKNMQDCFREHPDIYGDEIDDDDDDEEVEAKQGEKQEESQVNEQQETEEKEQVTASNAFEQGDDNQSWFSSCIMSSKKSKSKTSTPPPPNGNNKQQRGKPSDPVKDGANDNKKSIFGDWTGKTPITLLHEHCQKHDWEKAVIDMDRKKQGFVATVRLGKRNKKTAQIQTVLLSPPDIYFPTAVEARHAAATFALHRVNSHMNMHHVLPPQHRDLWRQFESLKTSANAWQYSPDPFNAQPPTPIARSKRQLPTKEHANAAIPMPLIQQQEQFSSTTSRSASAALDQDMDEKMQKFWASLPTVHMTSENRIMIESIVKQSDLVYQPSTKKLKPDEKQEIMDGLIKMGFRPSHVNEALDYCSDTASALDWLCLHVPEDDLPGHFLHGSYNPKMTTISHTTQSLGRDWLLKRMNSIGYPASICEEAMQQMGDDDSKALELLQWRLVHADTDMPEMEATTMDDQELKDAREEEIIALESIYESRFQREIDQDQRQHYKIQYMVQVDTTTKTTTTIVNKKKQTKTALPPRQPLILDIMIPTHSTYPHALPVFMIHCDGLPSYLKLSMIQGLVEEGERNMGMPMIYMCAEWLQEQADNLIANPPKLRKITDGLMTTPLAPKKVQRRNKKIGQRYQQQAPLCQDQQLSATLKSELESMHASDAYQPFATVRSKLPADAFKTKVIQAVQKHQVTIVSGETGCGKTTQVPQFLLDEAIMKNQGSTCSIICTQPRKISAIGVAERVAAERCEAIGQTVGYAIRGETKVSATTRLQFVTTGVLLRRIHSDPTLKGISHVMIDEVHERSVDSDFLLIILRQLIQKRKDIKIVLMSATINQELFSGYFGGAPTVEIPGFTHPVEDNYLEDILAMTTYVSKMPYSNKKDKDDEENGLNKPAGQWAQWQLPYLEKGYDERTVHSLARYRNQDKIDYDLVAQTVKYIVDNETLKIDDGTEPAILIFMPGAMEIKRCVESLQSTLPSSSVYDILPLHANLSPQEQTRVFKPVKKGVRKVVVATNVAETSITIEGVIYVIDSGRVKETQYDAGSNMMHLVETWASRASCKQRRGRAGRTRPGKCFKLFTRDTEERKMRPQQVPELLRTPLEQLCLQVKSMASSDDGSILDVKTFLRSAIDPPSITALNTALATLRAVDAIDDTERGDLTPLGKHMANIPADLRISKMLLFGSIFKCLDPILTIAATMSLKSPFTSPMEKREEAKEAREKFIYGNSDWLTDMRAYDEWYQIIKTRGIREARLFCEENFLSFATMTEIQSLRRQYADSLKEIGFYDPTRYGGDDYYNSNQENTNLLKSIIFGGLNPNLARIRLPDTKYDKVLSGTVEREKEAKEIKFYTKQDGRVFLHPASILFNTNQYGASFLTYFSRMTTSKTFLRDGTEVPSYAILFFGGKLDVDHLGRGLKIGDGWLKFRAWARIGVLVNQLKRLLSAELESKIEDPNQDISSSGVVDAMVTLISSDGI
ncbi:P-loop containing nucleoside triphosphate hydrolase protein [Halteromyces radiatus]|uniref:P-loop containing nucleoside triphosphate hydrolase protein n=1 Tax=Halteromyces radiatus TaxID=101107 RepID=UPI00221F2A19|nr:P-loop containing nucleoside triphosphate hydrolase protein [Halteromyces radiatus]KAI8077768.1 P-loop containing nucleoside triphosphate hydrolase protein [Halteromyces radiatus]